VGSGAVSVRATAASTASGVARSTGRWPTTATGAAWQRPTQGTRWMLTSAPALPCSVSISLSAPNSSQLTDSQTRTVSRGGRGASSFTTSKWW